MNPPSSGAMLQVGCGLDGETSVYRLFDAAGRLLYVGISPNPMARWASHASQHEWWPRVASYQVEWFSTRDLAAAEERRALREEDPECNIHGTSGWGAYLARASAETLARGRAMQSSG